MLNKDFREFVELLNAGGVEYLVVGGYALAAHGHPRYTGDIDFWIGTSDENIERLLKALVAFGFGGLGLRKEDFRSPDAVVQLGYPPARIDLLTGIDGVSFEDCYPRRVMVDAGGAQLPIIHVDDFKANKRATGRMKDLADLEALDEPPEDAH
ncbi:MAG: nucleotidyl transferase AbiEii/AbiGii toxin family protein [Pseudomonadota bacterium]